MAAPLVVVGGGRMGEALVGGLLAQAAGTPRAVVIVEASADRRAELTATGGLAARHPTVSVVAEMPPADDAIVAVKPINAEEVCGALAGAEVTRVLSIAAGVTVQQLETWLGLPVRVVRGMPNTPALVGAGVSAIAGGSRATDDDLTWAEGILGTVGSVVRVDERLLDGVTGLSGSGPAYVFLLAEAMIDAGVLVGLGRATARALTVQTLLGSARLLAESGEAPEVLRAAVTSPGGTTAAGLRALEAAGVRSAVLDAVSAAAERAAQMGREGAS